MIKYLLCTAVGVAIGYTIAQQRLSARYFEELQRETEDLQDFYRKKYKKEAEEESKLVEGASEALRSYQDAPMEPSPIVEEKPEPRSTPVKARIPKMPTDYTTMYRPSSPQPVAVKKTEVIETPEEPVREAEVIETPEEPVKESPSVEISEADFIANKNDCKQFSLTYFVADDILAGESYNVIDEENRNEIVGAATLEKLKKRADGSMIYVRSAMYEFEIVRSDDAYTDVVGTGEQSG